ncbi:hypothetical protein [Allomuricauda sp. d1]|uniref:hypothetical protein n=1 Tax=Allomuricauda sp. d1 TaxID=3136725 RepID=UPI0031DE5D48
MDVKKHNRVKKRIKVFLVFFYAGILLGCQEAEKPISVAVNFQDGKAVSVAFFHRGDSDSLNFFLVGNSDTPILGELKSDKSSHLFTPVVPFSSYQEYQIAYKGEAIAKFKVEPVETNIAPEILTIYPSRDTLPVNLLKMYFIFSQPMQHVGSPSDFITVFDETENKEVSPFLELEAELWNNDHQRLTLWLDPGRIKTDLIPNTEKGLPLKENHNYELVINKDWKSSQGTSLLQSHSKHFYVAARDVQKPNAENWMITVPQKNTVSPLKIDFQEPLDAILAQESIAIYKGDTIVEGVLSLTEKEKMMEFRPETAWANGEYNIFINPILEDLAGNNLNHLFDTDLKKENNTSNITEQRIGFVIK